jgi:hypothetical protein
MKPPADVQRWNELADELARIKAEELEQRRALVAKYFAADLDDGTHTVDVGAGHKLALTLKSTFKLAGEPETRAALQKLALADPAGPLLAERLVAWKPELRVGELKKLPAKLAKIIQAVLTVSPATPSLELRAPKA